MFMICYAAAAYAYARFAVTPMPPLYFDADLISRRHDARLILLDGAVRRRVRAGVQAIRVYYVTIVAAIDAIRACRHAMLPCCHRCAYAPCRRRYFATMPMRHDACCCAPRFSHACLPPSLSPSLSFSF